MKTMKLFKKYAHLGYQAASNCNSLPTFRDSPVFEVQ